MTETNFHHISLLAGTRDLAEECERFYRKNFGMSLSYSGLSESNDFIFMSDNVNLSVSPFEIIGKTAERREDLFLERHGPGLDHICFIVDNLDEVCEDLSSSGVSFYIPMYEFNGSFIAWCKDPAGVELELLQLGHGITESVGTLHAPKAQYNHVAIITDSRELAEATERFYRKSFGMVEFQRGGPSNEMDWIYLRNAGNTKAPWLEIVRAIFDEEIDHLEKHGTGLDHHCFMVDDAELYYSWLHENGISLETQIINMLNSKMFYLRDPSGVRVQVLQKQGRPSMISSDKS